MKIEPPIVYSTKLRLAVWRRLPAPTINQEEHGNQCHFPENIEERPVLGKKHAQHAEFGQQYADVIAPDADVDAGRSK